MEFDTKSQSAGSPDITDEQRLDASTRSVILQPLHADLTPDDMPDEYIANQHILGPPIANVDSDKETTTAVHGSGLPAQSAHRTTLILSLTSVTILFVLIISIIVLRSLR